MDRREQMRRWLARRERLGLTFRALSVETGVPVGTLACWAWKLRNESRGVPAKRRQPSFVELVAEGERADGRIEVVLRGERRVIVDADVDAAALARVVAALERC
ncbi:MAG: hypothetical protein HYZ53_09640 [Planctomycetes bacterium]|nr:hypothetical protein [Planctomycetota bacterium]